MNQSTREAAYKALREASDNIAVVDTHEHLPPEAARLQQDLSFTELFRHYTENDVFASGMSARDCEEMYAAGTSLERKWALFAPVYEQVRNGSYARAARLTMARFYGLSDLTSLEDARLVTQRMREANKAGLYHQVLKDACGIETCLVFNNEWHKDDMMRLVWLSDHFTEIGSMDMLRAVARDIGGVHMELSDYLTALKAFLARQKEKGIVGLKLLLAYKRDLSFGMPDREAAERLYRRVTLESLAWRPFALGYQEMKPLQDYLVHCLLRMAGELGLPVVFHTGIQAGNCNNLNNARIDEMWALFLRYPDTRFVLLHAALPFIDEAIHMAKYYPNVYLDLAWVHLISPEIARRLIRTCVDMVPRNKVMGFGGDYNFVELVYGHLQSARENIAGALAEKVSDGHLELADALAWQQAMLSGNAKALYGL